MQLNHTILNLAKDAAQKAGKELTSMIGDAGVISSQDKDIKTKADAAANEIIRNTLGDKYPIISEEHDSHKSDLTNPEGCWIVDPLDGTLNFTRGLPIVGVSIGFWRSGEPVAGVVLDFFAEKMYHGIVSESAFCNTSQIQVSTTRHVSDAVLGTGFPSGRNYTAKSLSATVSKVQRFKKVRMLGCASLMLTMVASGVFDAYEEEDIYLWDVAGALALVKAAGGEFTMTPGTGLWKYNVMATNGSLAELH
jgi:myo-inositol-1(or 4)-monophosphatase